MIITSTNILDQLYDFIGEIEKEGYKKSQIINFSIFLLFRRYQQISYEYERGSFWYELDLFCKDFKRYKKSSRFYKLKEVMNEKTKI